MRISDWSSDVCSSDLAELLASSQQQAFVALRTGNPGKMKPQLAGYKDNLAPNARAILDHVLQCSAVGTNEVISAGLNDFVARTGVHGGVGAVVWSIARGQSGRGGVRKRGVQVGEMGESRGTVKKK